MKLKGRCVEETLISKCKKPERCQEMKEEHARN
jgi:hypothetical protein